MIDTKFLNLVKQANNHPFNRHCLNLLKLVKGDRPPQTLHCLNLLIWAIKARQVAPREELADHLATLVEANPRQTMEYLEINDLLKAPNPKAQALDLLEQLNSALAGTQASYPPQRLANYR